MKLLAFSCSTDDFVRMQPVFVGLTSILQGINSKYFRGKTLQSFWMSDDLTLLCTEVWNMRESCGRPRSVQALDFLTGRHCVRETDVNTCVWFMCCLRVDVWCCLKCFWIGIRLKHPDLHMMSTVKVKRNTLTQFVYRYLSHTVFYACADWRIVVAFLSIWFPNRFPQNVPFDTWPQSSGDLFFSVW